MRFLIHSGSWIEYVCDWTILHLKVGGSDPNMGWPGTFALLGLKPPRRFLRLDDVRPISFWSSTILKSIFGVYGKVKDNDCLSQKWYQTDWPTEEYVSYLRSSEIKVEVNPLFSPLFSPVSQCQARKRIWVLHLLKPWLEHKRTTHVASHRAHLRWAVSNYHIS